MAARYVASAKQTVAYDIDTAEGSDRCNLTSRQNGVHYLCEQRTEQYSGICATKELINPECTLNKGATRSCYAGDGDRTAWDVLQQYDDSMREQASTSGQNNALDF